MLRAAAESRRRKRMFEKAEADSASGHSTEGRAIRPFGTNVPQGIHVSNNELQPRQPQRLGMARMVDITMELMLKNMRSKADLV
jgi:hypothetical protein